jgi:hypothetical protein
MGLFINNREYGTPYINGVRIGTAYINGRDIWPPFAPNMFVIRFVDPDTRVGVQGSITPTWSADGPNLEFKTPHGGWTPFESGTQITTEGNGYIAFRGKGRTALYKDYDGSPWIATKSFTVSGKLGNLINYENPDSPSVPACGFFGLFRNSPVIEADLTMNASAVTGATNGMSFGFMFEGSTLQKVKFTGMYKSSIYGGQWNNVFSNTPVTSVDIDLTAWGPSTNWSSTPDWMKAVPALGTYYKPEALPNYVNATNGLVAGWTVVNNK